MSETKRGFFDKDELTIETNPELPVIEATSLAPGVLKVKRGQKPPEIQSQDPDPIAQEVAAREKLEEYRELGRQQGGTSQGTAGGSRQKGGYNYNK